MTCKECLERMYPEDPRIRGGRYNRCGCDYCDKSTDQRELEEKLMRLDEILEQVPEKQWTSRQWDTVNQLRGLVLHLQRKVNEHLDKKKRVYNKYTL